MAATRSNSTNPPSMGTDKGPAWSPDGATIAFGRFIGATRETDVYVINPDGSGETNLTN